MSVPIEQLEVIIAANADQFRKELSDVNNRLGGINKGTTAVSGSFTKMGSVIKTVATGVVIAAIGKMVRSTTKFAMEAIESENLVGVVFGNMTGDITAWSNELSGALGMNAYNLRRNAGVFYNIADALGVTSDNALKLSKGMVSLAGDMASFYNITDDEAMVKLRAGITGETEPLKQLGIVVTENTIKDTAYRHGIAQTGAELSNSQKVLARYMTIMEQTATAQGDLARTISSPTNQLRILKSRIQELATQIGAIFIPVLNAVLPYIQAFIVLIMRAVKAVSAFLGIAGIKAKGIENIGDGMYDMGEGAGVAAQGVKALKKELMGLAAFDEMTVLKAPDSESGSGGGVGGGGGGFSDFELPEYDMGLKGIQNQVDEIIAKFDVLKKYLGEVFKPVSELWEKWAKPAFVAMGQFLKEMFDALGLNTEGVGGWAKAFQISGLVVVGVIGAIALVINGLLFLWLQFATEVGRIMNVCKLAVQGFTAFFKGDTESAVKFGLQIFSSFSPKVQEFFVQMAVKMLHVKDSIINAFVGIRNFVGSVIADIMGLFDNIGIKWNQIANNLGQAMIGALSSVTSWLRGFINTQIIRRLNDARVLINKIPGVNIPYIQPLAKGGIVESPTLAMIGESGREAVIPLENNTQWMNDLADKIGGGQPVNLVINLGEEKIYEKFIDFVNDTSLRSNTKLLNI